MELVVDLNQLVVSLSRSLDMAEGRAWDHARRSAFVTLCMAQKLGFQPQDQIDLCYAALLHDMGATVARGQRHHQQENMEDHCCEGQRLARLLPVPPGVAELIMWHHSWWDEGGPMECCGEKVPPGAHLLHLADRFEVAVGGMVQDLGIRLAWEEEMERGKERQFAPWAVEALTSCMKVERFWQDYANVQLVEVSPLHRKELLTLDQLEAVGAAFAEVIDRHSRFTGRHSRGVAKVARDLAALVGIAENRVRLVGVAGMLHDLGKLVVPREILDKPGRLDEQEMLLIKSHPYYSKRILKDVHGLQELANWGANHHERLDGKGYPERLGENQLGLEERIMAVADVYQALTEDRPYRGAMDREDALGILWGQVQEGALSGQAVEMLTGIA